MNLFSGPRSNTCGLYQTSDRIARGRVVVFGDSNCMDAAQTMLSMGFDGIEVGYSLLSLI